MSNSNIDLLTPGDCARKWCSSHDVAFKCFVSPRFDSLEGLVRYDLVERKNNENINKEWFWLLSYDNSSSATHQGFHFFININNASPHKGTVIVLFHYGKFIVYSNRVFYVYQRLKRQLRVSSYSETLYSGNIETDKKYNYYVFDSAKSTPKEKSEEQLQDEALRGLIDEVIECNNESNRWVQRVNFHVPASTGLLAELLDPLVESNPRRYTVDGVYH